MGGGSTTNGPNPSTLFDCGPPFSPPPITTTLPDHESIGQCARSWSIATSTTNLFVEGIVDDLTGLEGRGWMVYCIFLSFLSHMFQYLYHMLQLIH